MAAASALGGLFLGLLGGLALGLGRPLSAALAPLGLAGGLGFRGLLGGFPLGLGRPSRRLGSGLLGGFFLGLLGGLALGLGGGLLGSLGGGLFLGLLAALAASSSAVGSGT